MVSFTVVACRPAVRFLFSLSPHFCASPWSIEAKPAEKDEEGRSYLCDYKDDDVDMMTRRELRIIMMLVVITCIGETIKVEVE